MKRFLIALLLCLLLGAGWEAMARRGALNGLERLILRSLGQHLVQAHASLVLIELNDPDLPPNQRLFTQWPPGALDWALMTENLAKKKPAAVAIAPVLAWSKESGSQVDFATLTERLMLLPRPVFGALLQDSGAGQGDLGGLKPLPQVVGDRNKVPSFSQVAAIPSAELTMGKGLGFTQIDLGQGPKDEGLWRLVPLLARRGDDVVPSLALQTLMTLRNVTADQVSVILGREVQIGAGIAVPIDEAGRYRSPIDLRLPLHRIQAGDLALDANKDEKLLTGEVDVKALKAVEGALALMALTSQDSAHSEVSPGVVVKDAEITAEVLGRMLLGQHIAPAPFAWNVGLMGVLMTLALWLQAKRRWVVLTALFIALVAIWGLGPVILQKGVLLPLGQLTGFAFSVAGVMALLPVSLSKAAAADSKAKPTEVAEKTDLVRVAVQEEPAASEAPISLPDAARAEPMEVRPEESPVEKAPDLAVTAEEKLLPMEEPPKAPIEPAPLPVAEKEVTPDDKRSEEASPAVTTIEEKPPLQSPDEPQSAKVATPPPAESEKPAKTRKSTGKKADKPATAKKAARKRKGS